MRKRLQILLLSLAAAIGVAAAQESPYKFDFGGGIGMSGYLGDANSSSLLKHPGFTAEVAARYLPNVRWAVRGVLGYTTLKGNSAEMDNVLPGGAAFSFTSSVISLGVRGEFNFLPYGIGETYKKLRRWTPYLTIGIGACVAKCGSESTVAPTLPMGVGIKYKVKPRLNLMAEFTMTKIFSDKVDGSQLQDPIGIKTSFVKNTDWMSRITIGLSFEFGERCATCHYVD